VLPAIDARQTEGGRAAPDVAIAEFDEFVLHAMVAGAMEKT
jgi:hypothetical protein